MRGRRGAVAAALACCLAATVPVVARAWTPAVPLPTAPVAAPPVVDSSPRSTAGGWITLASSPLQRQEVVSTRIGHYVYLAGGFDNKSVVSRALERYDISTNSWRLLRPLPLALHHSAAVTYKGDMYVIGGYAADATGLSRSDGLALAILLKYSPRTDTWSELPPPPIKRGAFAAGVIGDRLYVAGGFNLSSGELRRLEIYDFKTQRWSRGPDMPGPAREHVAGTVCDGKLYVLGGRIDPGYLLGNLTVAERYDPVTNRWAVLPPLEFARSGASAVTVGDQVVVFGGEKREGNGVIAEVERFDARSDRWTRLADMLTPRHSMGAASFRGRVFALEGAPIPRVGVSNVAEALDVGR
jgi:N-acetylneuraminic acid mutarotase